MGACLFFRGGREPARNAGGLRGWKIFDLGVTAAVLFLGGVMARSLWVFPFDPALTVMQAAFSLGAIALLLAGFLVLMLARRLRYRFTGAPAMAAAGGILVVALSGDRVAWMIAISGLFAASLMIAWGACIAAKILVGAREGPRR